MHLFDSLINYFPFILLTIIIFFSILIISSLFNLNFKTDKNQKLKKKVSFSTSS